jgi:uracil-DNA glycosylase
MPNLEVVITMGWVAAKALLGGEPKQKTHEGYWFETTALPGIPVFCLPHPAGILREPSPEKDARVAECMKAFKREYLDSKKCFLLAQEIKEQRCQNLQQQ